MATWVERLKKWALAPTPLVEAQRAHIQAEAPDMVEAPVLGFVKTVLANPRRFRARREFPDGKTVKQYTWMTRDSTQFYGVTDKLLGHKFVVIYHNGDLYNVTGINIVLNMWEKRYLQQQLQPVFTRARKRKNAMRDRQERKVIEERRAAELKRRQDWTAVYGE